MWNTVRHNSHIELNVKEGEPGTDVLVVALFTGEGWRMEGEGWRDSPPPVITVVWFSSSLGSMEPHVLYTPYGNQLISQRNICHPFTFLLILNLIIQSLLLNGDFGMRLLRFQISEIYQ